MKEKTYRNTPKAISITKPEINPGMVLKRNNSEYCIENFDMDVFISKIINNNPKTHI